MEIINTTPSVISAVESKLILDNLSIKFINFYLYFCGPPREIIVLLNTLFLFEAFSS